MSTNLLRWERGTPFQTEYLGKWHTFAVPLWSPWPWQLKCKNSLNPMGIIYFAVFYKKGVKLVVALCCGGGTPGGVKEDFCCTTLESSDFHRMHRIQRSEDLCPFTLSHDKAWLKRGPDPAILQSRHWLKCIIGRSSGTCNPNPERLELPSTVRTHRYYALTLRKDWGGLFHRETP